MDFFSLHKSKKTSETGVWINDEEAENCACCGIRFNFLIRKHHCRQCGGVVCGGCSENRKFLESSRSGAPKRICDTCNGNDRGYGAGARVPQGQPGADDSDEDDGRRGAAGAGAAPDVGRLKLDDEGSAQPRRAAQPRLPDIPVEEASAALAAHPFEGRWQMILLFSSVELTHRPGTADAALSQLSGTGAFKASGKGRNIDSSGGPVKVGSRVRVFVELETKGAAYFKGTCPEFGQFGTDGKVTGSLQRTTGKVNATIQIVSAATRVTTSFNFVGLMTSNGILSGNFSGCEISKTAGSVAGTFKMMKAAPADGGDEGGDASEEEAPRGKHGHGHGHGHKSSSSKKSPGRGGRGGSSGSDGGSGSESDGGKKRHSAGRKGGASKKAAASDSGSGSGSDDSAPRKPAKGSGKAKKKAAASDSDSE